jgi:hypothetical protein
VIEDKLTHDERLRLECLAQVTALHSMGQKPTPEQIINQAKKYEAFIKGDSDAAEANS